MDDRPPPTPEKLLRQFRDWLDESELPGRTMSNLKTGFLPEVLDEQTDTPEILRMRQAWGEWEAGSTDPTAVLTVLHEGGLEAMLGALIDGSSEE